MKIKILFRLIFKITNGYDVLIKRKRKEKGNPCISKKRLKRGLSIMSISEPKSHTL